MNKSNLTVGNIQFNQSSNLERAIEESKKEVPEVEAQKQLKKVSAICTNCNCHLSIEINKKCPKCNIAYEKADNYCRQCGSKLEEII